MRTDTQSSEPHFYVFNIDLNPDKLATQFHGGGTGGEAAGKRIQYPVIWVRGCQNYTLQEGFGFLGGVVFVFVHQIANAWELPDISRHFFLIVWLRWIFSVVY